MCVRRSTGRLRRRLSPRPLLNSLERCSGDWAKRGEFAEGRQWLERALTVNARAPGSLRARA